MGTERKVMFVGSEVTARELTVKEIDQVLSDMEDTKSEVHMVDLLFGDEPISAKAVSLSTGLELAAMVADGVTPSDVKKVIDQVKEVNPTFVGMMSRLVNVGGKLLNEVRPEGSSTD